MHACLACNCDILLSMVSFCHYTSIHDSCSTVAFLRINCMILKPEKFPFCALLVAMVTGASPVEAVWGGNTWRASL